MSLPAQGVNITQYFVFVQLTWPMGGTGWRRDGFDTTEYHHDMSRMRMAIVDETCANWGTTGGKLRLHSHLGMRDRRWLRADTAITRL